MAIKLSIIIPTMNRARMVQTLLNSIRDLAGLDKFQPQIIVGDNNSQDETWKLLHIVAKNFSPPLTLLADASKGSKGRQISGHERSLTGRARRCAGFSG